jgi:hypothetical protein
MTTLQISTIPEQYFEREVSLAVASLVVLKILYPSTYEDIHTGAINISDLQLIFELNETSGRSNARLFDSWQFFLDTEQYAQRKQSELNNPPKHDQQLKQLQILKRNHLEVFHLNAGQ